MIVPQHGITGHQDLIDSARKGPESPHVSPPTTPPLEPGAELETKEKAAEAAEVTE